MNVRKEEPTGLIIHCSDSNYGTTELFKQWHLDNGWDDIGYNWVITNGIFKNRSRYKNDRDGIIQPGRDTKYIAAHAKGYNESHLSICLVGRFHFTWKQFATSLKWGYGATLSLLALIIINVAATALIKLAKIKW